MAEETKLLLETLSDLRVVDLKRELEKRKLSKSGSKKDLCERLRNHLKIEELRYKNAEQGSDATSTLNLPSADAGMETNEFVKSYLEQREKLLERQMEQKKKYQEEAYKSQESESQSEAEDLSQQHHQSTQQIPERSSESKPELSQEETQQVPKDEIAGKIEESSKDAPQDRPEYNSETDEDTEDEGGQYAPHSKQSVDEVPASEVEQSEIITDSKQSVDEVPASEVEQSEIITDSKQSVDEVPASQVEQSEIITDSKQSVDEVPASQVEQSEIIKDAEEQVEPLVLKNDDSFFAPSDEVVEKTDALLVSQTAEDADVTMESELSQVADVTIDSETFKVVEEHEKEDLPSSNVASEVDIKDDSASLVKPLEPETQYEEDEPSKIEDELKDLSTLDVEQVANSTEGCLNESHITENELTINNSEVFESEVSTAEESVAEVEEVEEDSTKREAEEQEEREETSDSSSPMVTSQPGANMDKGHDNKEQTEEVLGTSVNSEDLLEVMVQKEDEFDEVKMTEDDDKPSSLAKFTSLEPIPEDKEVAQDKTFKKTDNTTTVSRRLLRNSQKAEEGETIAQVKPLRKRKWGSVELESHSVAISSESLKSIIPDVMIDLSVPCDVMIDVISTEEEEPTINKSKIFKRQINEPCEQDDDVKKRKPVVPAATSTSASKVGRTIYQDVGNTSTEKEDTVAIQRDNERQRERRVVERRATSGGEAPERNVVMHRKESETDASQVDNENELKKRKLNPSMQLVDEPMAVERGKREATPPRNPVSRFIHIFNLVRPYTLNQLKEILQRTGTLVESGFWIDKIKSHCIAEFETSEQAVASREALHGKKWPACNPKILRVEFSDENELERLKNIKEGNPMPLRIDRMGNIGITASFIAANVAAAANAVKSTETAVQQDETRKNAKEPRRSPERPKERDIGRRRDENERRREDVRRADERPAQLPVRDWDRNKVRASEEREDDRGFNRRRRRSSERDHHNPREDETKRRRKSDAENEMPAVNSQKEEPPAKLLDDLFRKTKATPCIYWLPLTEEQIAEKEKQKKRQEAEFLQRRAERDKKYEEERNERIRARGQKEGDRRRDF